MNVAFGWQAFGGGRELHFVGAAGDDSIAETDTALETDLIAVPCGDFHVAAGEPLAADLHEDVRSTSFQEDRRFGDRPDAKAIPFIEHGRAALPDEELTARVLDFELHRERAGLPIDHAGVVPG